MVRGLYTSGTGMIAQMKRMDVLTNNLANVDTTGYKKDLAVTRTFPEELALRLDDPRFDLKTEHAAALGKITYGTQVDLVKTDFSAGSLRNVGGQTNLAISGEGFFSVNVTDKNGGVTEQYTRDGSFILSSDRILMTSEGNKVIGENGEIVLPNTLGEIAISRDGAISVDGQIIDRIKLVNFENPDTLRKVGNNFFATTDETNEIPFGGDVVQGFLENSNSNVVKEMVEMITLNRVYEANSKALITHDSIMQKTAEIGRK